jgi:hypothetical protein
LSQRSGTREVWAGETSNPKERRSAAADQQHNTWQGVKGEQGASATQGPWEGYEPARHRDRGQERPIRGKQTERPGSDSVERISRGAERQGSGLKLAGGGGYFAESGPGGQGEATVGRGGQPPTRGGREGHGPQTGGNRRGASFKRAAPEPGGKEGWGTGSRGASAQPPRPQVLGTRDQSQDWRPIPEGPRGKRSLASLP